MSPPHRFVPALTSPILTPLGSISWRFKAPLKTASKDSNGQDNKLPSHHSSEDANAQDNKLSSHFLDEKAKISATGTCQWLV